jgi:hypothetical protein
MVKAIPYPIREQIILQLFSKIVKQNYKKAKGNN